MVILKRPLICLMAAMLFRSFSVNHRSPAEAGQAAQLSAAQARQMAISEAERIYQEVMQDSWWPVFRVPAAAAVALALAIVLVNLWK